jgi:hypothetical protein
MYPPRRTAHNGLIHEVAMSTPDVIPEIVDTVDSLWRKPTSAPAA